MALIVKAPTCLWNIIFSHWRDTIFVTSGMNSFPLWPWIQNVKTDSPRRNTADAVFSLRPSALQTCCIARMAPSVTVLVLPWWTCSKTVTLTENWVIIWGGENDGCKNVYKTAFLANIISSYMILIQFKNTCAVAGETDSQPVCSPNFQIWKTGKVPPEGCNVLISQQEPAPNRGKRWWRWLTDRLCTQC